MHTLFRGEEFQKSKSGVGKDLEEFELYLPVIVDESEKSHFLSWPLRGRVTWKQRTLKTDHTLVLPTLISITIELLQDELWWI